MAEYNGYKIKRTHSLTPFTSVYEATDEKGGRFALKVFHPPASTNLRRQYAIESWLLAAERQQQSARKDGAVLEVLTYGRCEEGAFAVYPWRERFLEPWIKTLHPKGNTLRALAEFLFNTIEKWEKETGGPHGNLKPANIFPDRSGSLVGMTAKLSDPAFALGAKTEELRQADLMAVGAMLATIVRRRPPGAWPIEEAPEWKALGHPGKGWLDFCNFLLNPQPGEGEVTLAKARQRLKKIPKDANPIRTAALTIAALVVLGGVSVIGFARFGNPIYMPGRLQDMAQTIGNPRAQVTEVPPAWEALCVAWDTWLGDLQSNGRRLLRTEGLLDPNGQLYQQIENFLATANELRPETLAPSSAGERRLGVLAKSPPPAVLKELLTASVAARVETAGSGLARLELALVDWSRWEQLRDLQKKLADRGYTRTAEALAAKVPQARGTEGYKRDIVRVLKLLNDVSLDTAGTLPLVDRWAEISKLSQEMLAVDDRIQKAMPQYIVYDRLTDQPSLSDFADSLMAPLEEMRKRRKQFNDPQVVRERFLKESDLLKETNPVTADDFPRWEKELFLFSLVPDAQNPSRDPKLDATATQLARDAADLERDAPESEPGQPATLSEEDFKREIDGLNANLRTLRGERIVQRDLPEMGAKTTKLADLLKQLGDRLTYTLSLLNPGTWLTKVRQDYGTFTESKNRWRNWLETFANVTAESLSGAAGRPRFRQLRANERRIRDWINGLEGPEGFGALKVPDLAGTASQATARELQRLEAVFREKAATAVGAAETWTDALPATLSWGSANARMRAPLEQHSLWLGRLADFAKNLDDLSEHLLNGKVWEEGVDQVVILLRAHEGEDDLAGEPGGWWTEANALEKLNGVSGQAALLAAAQVGGLSRKLTAWRKLGDVADWPAGPAEFDVDAAIVAKMRELIRNVKEEGRGKRLLDEMAEKTRVRFNRTAMFAARSENLLTDMFSSRMASAGIKEADLEPRVAFNFYSWRFRRADRNVKQLDVLGARRDAYVNAVKSIDGGRLAARSDIAEFLAKLQAIELKDIPGRVFAPTPASVGWNEDFTNEGLGLVASWRSGSRTVRLEYAIVEPLDDTPPFFLARRVIAVGEFIDLLAGRPKDWEAVKETLQVWATKDTSNKPWNMAIAWQARSDFSGLELTSSWIPSPDATVKGILENPELLAANPALAQAAGEKPSLRSPLQQVTSRTAKVFAEKVLGARLPTIKEWQAVIQAAAPKTEGAFFRGPNFQQLWRFTRDYKVIVNTATGPLTVTTDWRPNVGSFMQDNKSEEAPPSANADDSRFWFRPVDEGPKSGKAEEFINLLGNVSIFLTGTGPKEEFYVAGGSVLSRPTIDFTQPQKVGATGSTLIGGRAGSEAFTDVGIRPAFDAPPGFKERYNLLKLVRELKYLTL